MGDGRTDEHIEIRQANNFGIKIVSFVCYFIALGSFGVLREWVLDNQEVKNEEKMPFALFEKCK